MEKNYRRKRIVVSSMPDEQLAMILQDEYNRTPSEFSCMSYDENFSSGSILRNTSGRGIEPMKKWL